MRFATFVTTFRHTLGVEGSGLKFTDDHGEEYYIMDKTPDDLSPKSIAAWLRRLADRCEMELEDSITRLTGSG